MWSVVIDGGEIELVNRIDGGEIELVNYIDGGELSTTTIATGRLQNIEVIPSSEEQIITASEGYDAIASVKVGKVPSNYGLITYNGSVITVS